MNEPLFGYDSAEQKQSPEQGIHSQCTNGFHVSHQVHLQNSRLYSYLLYAKLLCKCRIDFICRIYRSCFDGINTLLEFCIKQAAEAFGELKQDMLPLLPPPPMSLSFCPYYKHLILFSHFDFVMLYHFF